MMELKLDLESVEKAVIDKAVERFFDQHYDIKASIEAAATKRLNELFAEQAEASIASTVEKALDDAFNREYTKRTAWGEAEGPPTTIAKELERLMADFWKQKVDKQGKPSESYGATARVDYVMTKVAGEDFMKNLEQHLIGSAAQFKDGLRGELRGRVDQMLANLFHVQTQQDKAEGRYK